jgi:hypothetical protein
MAAMVLYHQYLEHQLHMPAVALAGKVLQDEVV